MAPDFPSNWDVTYSVPRPLQWVLGVTDVEFRSKPV